jgi:hypothetical protein
MSKTDKPLKTGNYQIASVFHQVIKLLLTGRTFQMNKRRVKQFIFTRLFL